MADAALARSRSARRAAPDTYISTRVTMTNQDLQDRIELLEDVVGQCYQLAGEVGAPRRVLDLLSAAEAGRPLPAETFLPDVADECSEVAEARHALARVMDAVEPYLRMRLAARAGSAASERKAASARANGRKGGRRGRRPARRDAS